MRLIINLVGVELLHWLTETYSTGHTGSIHVNVLEGRHVHTHILTSRTKAISKNQLAGALLVHMV